MSKYQPLTDHLRRAGAETVPMAFEDIERVIGAKLPRSASHRAWWSNNPSNNVMTAAWLAAGYESSQVVMKDRTLVFRRVEAAGTRETAASRPAADPSAKPATSGGPGGSRDGAATGSGTLSAGTAANGGSASPSAPSAPDESQGQSPDWFAGCHGGLRGTVTIAPDPDLTAPAGDEWDAERER